MIGPTDFSTASVVRVTTSTTAWHSEARPVVPFDPAGSETACIDAQLPAGCRGLSVEVHTERVLSHLLAERDQLR